MKTYLATPKDETASQALERLEKLLVYIRSTYQDDEDVLEMVEKNYAPFVRLKPSHKDMNDWAVMHGVIWPPSYLDFVLRHGIISFGKGFGTCLLYTSPSPRD